MKKLQAPIAFVAICFPTLLISCKKDVNEVPAGQEATISASSMAPSTSSWKAEEWSTTDNSVHTLFSTTKQASITKEDLQQGLVRVFRTDASGAQKSLPFTETINGVNYSWYYQASENNVEIIVDAIGSKENPAVQSDFKIVVLKKEDVSRMESQGHSKTALMNARFEDIQTK